ncbi:MAG: hypothetical protein KatS3mg105_2485 [Gemmatales bacterium]|nr:MAG: hypothetical protein KatS3mg105_2485 [Gemmatales bacterium]
MKCSAVQTWLLGMKSSEVLPDELRRHLDTCQICRSEKQQLDLLNELFAQLPTSDNSQKRAAMLQKLDSTRQQRPSRRTSVSRYAAVAGLAAAILLSFTFGWLVRNLQQPAGSVPPRSHVSDETDFMKKILEHHLALARTTDPHKQLQTLSQLADDLRLEAEKAAQDSRVNDLVRIASLYDSVVRHGVVGRAFVLPAADRQTVVGPIARQLQQTQHRLGPLAEQAVPAVASIITTMQESAKAAQSRLREAAPAEPLNISSSPEIVTTLVYHGLLLANEEDPLLRAEHCSDVADSLVRWILQASAEGDAEMASELGAFLSDVTLIGIEENLSRVEPEKIDIPSRRRFEELKQKANKAKEVLQQNLERAPKSAQFGLQRALEATQRGRPAGRQQPNGGKQKGKGPPFLPPGLRKKR